MKITGGQGEPRGARFRLPRVATDTTAPPHLTPRESQVVTLTADGLTARQIGRRLGLSTRTVEHHVARVKQKIGLRNRASLVRYALDHGLIERAGASPTNGPGVGPP